MVLIAFSQQVLNAQIGLSGSRVYYLGAGKAEMKNIRTHQLEIFYSFSIPGVKGDTLPKSHFRLSPTFQWTDITFENNVSVNRSNGLTIFETLEDPEVDFLWSDLCVGSLQMRGQLQLKNKDGSGYARYSPGAYVGYAVLGRFKRSYRIGDDKEKVKMPLRDDPDFYGLKRLQAGHFGTFTYGVLALWYGVSFTPFFEKGQGPQFTELRFGALIGLPIYFKKGKRVHAPSISI